MDDLLVQPRSVPSVRLKTAKSLPRLSSSSRTGSLWRRSAGNSLYNGSSLLGPFSRTVKGVSDFWLSLGDGLTSEERDDRRRKDERRQILCLRMKNAETLKVWERAAEELDGLEGNDDWKRDESPGDYYNPILIATRLRELDEARASCDIRLMMHLIRTSLSRDLGGMGNPGLYHHTYVGTKRLIEQYVSSATQTIDAVLAQSQIDAHVQHRDLLEGMLFARQSFGRSALLLSGGGTFGMAHIGVLKALYLEDLLPRIISGASAGSIVCAVMCTRTDEEMPQLMQEFAYGDFAVFDGEDDGPLEHLRRLLTEGSWSDVNLLTSVMRGNLGDMTFQEAYNRTRRILNIGVSSASVYELPRLLNYVTAPNVIIWSAVAASCSVPLVYSAAPLLVKDPLTGEHRPWNPAAQHWIDGSVDNDLPMARLSEMFNVNHFIVSQVNPHVVPFLTRDDRISSVSAHHSLNTIDPNTSSANGESISASFGKPRTSVPAEDTDMLRTLTTLARSEALHRLHFLAELGILPNLTTKLRSILSQKYSGDITILPEVSMHDLPRLLSNPTTDFMLRMSLAGERATWPKISQIRDRCAIEIALDHTVYQLRAKVVFSQSQQDLRKLHSSPTGPTAPTDSPVANQRRQRRRSGGSLHQQPEQRRSLPPDAQASDDRPGVADNSSNARHGNAEGSAGRKPRLERASKSLYVVPKDHSSLKLIMSDGRSGQPSRLRDPSAVSTPTMFIPSNESPSPGGFVSTTTTEEPETSEQGPSSDADTEQITEDSDFEANDFRK